MRDRRGKRILLEGQIRGLMTIASEMGVFLLPPDPKAWAIYDRKGVKIFPKAGAANLSQIARYFPNLPSQHRADDWGDSLK